MFDVFFGWCPVFRDVFNVFERLCEGVPVVFVVNVSVLACFLSVLGGARCFKLFLVDSQVGPIRVFILFLNDGYLDRKVVCVVVCCFWLCPDRFLVVLSWFRFIFCRQ